MLLRLLEEDSSVSDEDLALQLNCTPEEVREEKQQLKEDGIICGYNAVVNWDKLQNDHCSAIITVCAKPEREAGYDRIASRIARYPEVSSLYLMSGSAEFFVFIDGHTIQEVADFVARKLAPIEGVTSTTTCIQLKAYKIAGHPMDDDRREDERMLVEP